MYYVWSTLIMYLTIVISMRLLGKRQIGELQATELVVAFLIADLAVIPLQNADGNLLTGIIPIAVLVLCEIAASWLMLRSSLVRRLLCGKPVVIIKEGKLIPKALKELRISVDELFEELRNKDVFNIDEVYYAIVETNGSMSILLKGECETVKKTDLNLNSENTLAVTVIADGELSKASMSLIGIDKSDIERELKRRGLKPEDVFIMLMDANKNTTIIQKS